MLSEKQEAYLLGANRRWNIKSGATRSGKTWLDIAYTIPRRVLRCGDDGLIVLIGHTQETVRRNLLEPMRALYGGVLVGHIHQGTGAVRLFGRTCHVLGADTAARAKALQGAGIAYCYGDEITTWAEPVFSMLQSRLDKPGSTFDGTCNPAGPNHWFRKFLQSGADIFLQEYTIDDNPYLPPGFVQSLKAEYAGTVYYDRFILGRWVLAEGLIYRGFDRARHVVPTTPKLRRIGFAADIGHANATAFLALGEAADGRLYVLDEYYHSGRESGQPMSPLAYARAFAAFSRRNLGLHPQARALGVYVDPSAIGFLEQLREIGVASAHRARNDVLRGIAAVQSLIERDALRVLPRCTHLLDELAAYRWDERAAQAGEDRPVKVDDHAVDALRYWVASVRPPLISARQPGRDAV